ncbi:MAG TPA: hypothetical protein VMZ53_16605 [Kofleriaceae bacterium]|nr:hypothetical protein [Kofleriaceae bacterium]
MNIDDIKPANCYARARRLLGEVSLVRDELGRSEDTRQVPEITGAQPRECYFEAIAAWRKAERLADELGVHKSRALPRTPTLRDIRPGHVYQVLEGVLHTLGEVKSRLDIAESVVEPGVEPSRQPSDVLATIIRINRELSRCLERPFTPTDVYETVALASAYASQLGATAELAPFERKRKPQHCYEMLASCLTAAASHVTQKGEQALVKRGMPVDVLPGDVYDLAILVLGELAFLHSLTPNAATVQPFTPVGRGHRIPSDCYQLARTLEKQLTSLK